MEGAKLLVLTIFSLASLLATSAQQCGSAVGGATCAEGLCCSQYCYCGSTSAYCGTTCQSQCGGCSTCQSQCDGGTTCQSQCSGGTTCQSQCSGCSTCQSQCGSGTTCQSQCGGGSTPTPTPSGGGGGVGSLISSSLFEQMLKHRNDAACPASGFYTYNAFIAAANSFSGFGTTGNSDTQKREIAAFLAETSHETTGGCSSAPDGPYACGYCIKQEQGNPGDYCLASPRWTCAPGKKYYGRGPIQISYNYNYGPAGNAIGSDLLGNPDLVASDPTISFKTAIWFWMTAQSPKPSCHAVITGAWTPSATDQAAGRVPGLGVITNIINGGIECGKGTNAAVADRIGFYRRYCDLLGVSYGCNLDCYNQQPFN